MDLRVQDTGGEMTNYQHIQVPAEGQKITVKLQPHGNYSNVPTFTIS